VLNPSCSCSHFLLPSHNRSVRFCSQRRFFVFLSHASKHVPWCFTHPGRVSSRNRFSQTSNLSHTTLLSRFHWNSKSAHRFNLPFIHSSYTSLSHKPLVPSSRILFVVSPPLEQNTWFHTARIPTGSFLQILVIDFVTHHFRQGP